MLSVLIPVYNWDITDLVSAVDKQCREADFDYEILALDDCSQNKTLRSENSKISLEHFRLIELDENVGNAEARNILARSAKYDWQLFLDADMLPANNDFIAKYLQQIRLDDFDIMSGGIVYAKNVAPEYRLKWLHGTKTEEQQPGKDPYLEIRGNNFLVRRKVFLDNPFGGLPENYGYVDTHFGLKLKQAGVRVKIINNPCIHLGLETNRRFVEKYEKALKNAFWLNENHPEMAENLRIIQAYKKVKKTGMKALIAFGFRMTKGMMLKNLYSERPSLFIFQLYKLGYTCSI